jgi:hypothetical protein
LYCSNFSRVLSLLLQLSNYFFLCWNFSISLKVFEIDPD